MLVQSTKAYLRWPIYILNSVDKIKLSCNTPTDAAPQFKLPPFFTASPAISLFTVLFTADVFCWFFACFLVRNLFRIGCRHNYMRNPVVYRTAKNVVFC